MWCNVGFAEIELNCNMDSHVKNYSELVPEKNEDVTYDKWLDLDPFKLSLKIKKDEIFAHKDYEIEMNWPGITFNITNNDRRYIVGKIIVRDSVGIIVNHLVYDKKFKFLSILYYSDYGIAIYDGYCN